MLKDCDAQFFSNDEAWGGGGYGGPNYFMRITLTLKENPLRYVEFRGNPINGKLGSDLATWLNVKLAENEVNQPKVVKT